MREPENVYKYIVLQGGKKNTNYQENTNTPAGKESSTTGQ